MERRTSEKRVPASRTGLFLYELRVEGCPGFRNFGRVEAYDHGVADLEGRGCLGPQIDQFVDVVRILTDVTDFERQVFTRQPILGRIAGRSGGLGVHDDFLVFHVNHSNFKRCSCIVRLFGVEVCKLENIFPRGLCEECVVLVKRVL
jgi:hypothetical protein